MSDLYLGIDLGTSGVKVAAVREDGTVAAQAEASYTVERPHPGYAEIAPQQWDDAVQRALEPMAGLRFASVGIAGQMHGLVLVDDEGAPCRPAMLWPDRRALGELAAWRGLSSAQRLRLANPLVAGMAGPMLHWVKDNEPLTWQCAAVALQPKDYVRFHLGGPLVAERSDASATLLWDIPGDTWDLDIVAALGLPAELLPDVVPSHWVVGQAALPGEPALVAGAGDTPAALLGTGGLQTGQVQINLGTGAQILVGVAEPRPTPDPLTHLYADAASAWYGMAAIQNGGLALNRAREWLGLQWSDFFAAAASSQTGAGGVSVIPYLAGERGGVAQPSSRGAWLGMSDATTPADLARAAIEGMLFTVRQGVELLAGAQQAVRVSGGGVREPFVAQMLADVLDATISVVPDRSASALGAAMLAATGVGQTIAVASGQPLVFEPRENGELEHAYRRWVARRPAGDM